MTRPRIASDDPRRPDVVALIEEHLEEMRAWSPPGTMFALDLDGLAAPGIAFFSARSGDELLGIAAIKDLWDGTGELKSMRTARAARGQGVGRLLLEHAVSSATARGWRALYLETGTQPGFAAARSLYASRGFVSCPPFADYVESPHNTFMVLRL